jgi:hypothetical protein
MTSNESKGGVASSKEMVTVRDWQACYNKGDNVIALSCTVSTVSSDAAISGVGLMLNNSAGATLASTYTELSNGSASVTPSINLPPGSLAVGDTVVGVVSGEVQGQHYFFEQKLTISNC